jgi:hypothetical protein
MCRCAAAGGDLEEPLIAHPQCCYFEGAQGTTGCYSDVDTPRPHWRKLQDEGCATTSQFIAHSLKVDALSCGQARRSW